MLQERMVTIHYHHHHSLFCYVRFSFAMFVCYCVTLFFRFSMRTAGGSQGQGARKEPEVKEKSGQGHDALPELHDKVVHYDIVLLAIV